MEMKKNPAKGINQENKDAYTTVKRAHKKISEEIKKGESEAEMLIEQYGADQGN